MELNSCLYTTTISHRRLLPKAHAFSYKFFSFYIDLDEIGLITRRIPFIGHNRFNLYSLYDKDHLGGKQQGIKENILGYLRTKGIELSHGRIMLLTYLRMAGYVFNPVSFYFCFNPQGEPVCVVPEIGNTFGELKPFLIDTLKEGIFKDTQDKFYYISPFNKLDDQLDYKITIPDDQLKIHIDTSRQGQKVMLATVAGQRCPLHTFNLLKLTLQFPLITLRVILLIHWHAVLLWFKKVPFETKENNPHLQQEVFHARNQHQ